MEKAFKYAIVSSTLLVSIGALAGCSTKTAIPQNQSAKESQNETSAEVNMNQPITLTVFGNNPQDVFDQQEGNFLKKKYPAITFKYIQSKKGATLQDLVASGNVPDIILGGAPEDIAAWVKLGIGADLNPLIQKYKMDLNQFEPSLIQDIKNQSSNGDMYGLPFQQYFNAFYYNKDIFDKFGIKYPTNGMSWSQVYDLSQQLTKVSGDIQYHGLDLDAWNRLSSEYPLNVIDSKTNKANLSTPQWTNLIEYFNNVYAIPGNRPTKDKGYTAFTKDKNVAMMAWSVYWQAFEQAVQKGLHYDIVSFPTWPDAKGQGPAATGPIIGMSSTTQYPDQAFNILEYLDSHEVQLANARQGYASALNSQDVKDQYCADLPYTKGINVKAVFYDKPAVMPKNVSPEESVASGDVWGMFNNIESKGTTDINTLIRQTIDKIDKTVASDLQKKSSSK